jgi:putative N6-adenine-specific DNA methylase
MPVSRAGRKLEAALARFDLDGAVSGARAVDVGASTGGFTEALLAHGAASVLAVDVGHGQLHETLRADARVTSLERTDWRRLPLDVAEGPFDFFTVDVSFASARNMLRGLAFRLRPGAQGVVLVKPQFELPDRRIKAAGIDDPNLRREAVDKVRTRAEALGFALIAHADSPVAGESGTVEILAHLRFDGRPASLPRKGERRAPASRATHAPSAETSQLNWFAVVAPGLEEAAGREVAAALPDARDVRVVPGGVEWRGPAASGVRANLWLRIATRVLARVGGDFEARDFAKLRRLGARLPWRSFVPEGAKLAVRASASKSRLYHTGAITENLLLAVRDAVPGVREAEKDEDADLVLLARVVDDRFTISADASGERLHRRGARTEAGAAPLRETLAAGLLALADWNPSLALVDPMCGTGAIAIEAAMQAADRAPGLERAFAIEHWPIFDAKDAAALRDEARARVRNDSGGAASIFGSDRDARAIDSAQRNAARAGVEARITFTCRAAADVRAPAPSGLVVTNPPYGRRLGDPRAAARGYRDLGLALRAHFHGWRAAILVPATLDPDRALALRGAKRFALRNGGLPVSLVVGEV